MLRERWDQFNVDLGRWRKRSEEKKRLERLELPGSGANPHAAGSGWQSAWNASLSVDSNALKAAINCDPAEYATWVEETDSGFWKDARPINCITWHEALAFCIWDGARLPSEAEWNYAAAAGSEQRVYPWSEPPTSTTIDPFHAVYGPGFAHIRNVGGTSLLGDG